MQDYDKWPEFAKPMVTGVQITKMGDQNGNGLVRRVNYKLPLGLWGTSVETVHDSNHGVGYTYTSLKSTVGRIRLEKLDPGRTRLHFEEELRLRWPFSWFEGSIQKFIEKQNKRTMFNMSLWLTVHTEYQAS